MARAACARTAITAASLNITDLAYTTMTLGANNGVEIPYQPGDLLVLYNHTAGPAVYTIKTVQPTVYSAESLTVPDKTFTVAATKMHVLLLTTIWRNADGKLYVDCDIAAKIAMLAVAG